MAPTNIFVPGAPSIGKRRRLIDLGGASNYRRSVYGWNSLAATLTAASSPTFDGQTHQIVHTLEAPVVAVRAIILNNEAGTPTINAVAVSPSTTLPANRSPTGGSWTQVTFGGSASVVLPAALGTNRPSRTVSDWMPVSSVAPTDGTTLPYMFWRTYYATGPASAYLGSAYYNATGSGALAASGATVWPNPADSRTAGRIVATNSKTGDFVSTNQAGFATPNTNFAPLAMEFEYQYASPVVTVCAIGDSITQGDTGSINCLSPVHFACGSISTAQAPVLSCNEGWSNQTTTNFAARLGDMINSGRKPSILVYSSFSPNDTPGTVITQGEVDTMTANVTTALSLCRSNGIYPILSTGIPWAYTGASEALRNTYNNYIRGLASANVGVVDYDAAVSNGASPAVIQFPNYTALSGNLHPYDDGYVQMGTVLATALQAAIAKFH